MSLSIEVTDSMDRIDDRKLIYFNVKRFLTKLDRIKRVVFVFNRFKLVNNARDLIEGSSTYNQYVQRHPSELISLLARCQSVSILKNDLQVLDCPYSLKPEAFANLNFSRLRYLCFESNSNLIDKIFEKYGVHFTKLKHLDLCNKWVFKHLGESTRLETFNCIINRTNYSLNDIMSKIVGCNLT